MLKSDYRSKQIIHLSLQKAEDFPYSSLQESDLIPVESLPLTLPYRLLGISSVTYTYFPLSAWEIQPSISTVRKLLRRISPPFADRDEPKRGQLPRWMTLWGSTCCTRYLSGDNGDCKTGGILHLQSTNAFYSKTCRIP